MRRASTLLIGLAFLLPATGCASAFVHGELQRSGEDSISLRCRLEPEIVLRIACHETKGEVTAFDRTLTVGAHRIERPGALDAWALDVPTGTPRDDAEARLRALWPSTFVVFEREGEHAEVLLQRSDSERRAPAMDVQSRRWSFFRQLGASALVIPAFVLDVVLSPFELIGFVVYWKTTVHDALF